MAVIALLVLGLALASAQENRTSLEERVFEDVARMWQLFPQNVVEGFVGYFDLLEFFERYDTNTSPGGLRVDENEFAVGMAADLEITEDEARAYFKSFNVGRQRDQIFRAEVIDEQDIAWFLEDYAWLDLGLDDEGFEFWFGLDNVPFPFGVSFMQYRQKDSDPVNYDDYLTSNPNPNPEEEGDWEKMFDDMDFNGDGWLDMSDYEASWVGEGYGILETATAMFNRTDTDRNGLVDKYREFKAVFELLQVDGDASGPNLTYDEYINIYAWAWEIEPVSREERNKDKKFSFERHMELMNEKRSQKNIL